jgi:hypothetical protein
MIYGPEFGGNVADRGGSRGIGSATAKRVAEFGASVSHYGKTAT